jgi:hypothetical protein
VDNDTSDIRAGSAAQVREHGFNRAGNANSKIMAGRQRLGGGENALAFAVEHGIGIGAAGIDPEKKR